MAQNTGRWFEIYVADMARARAFYEAVLGVQLTAMVNPNDEAMPGMEMWSFPSSMEGHGIGGALVKMDGFGPGPGGTIVYLGCDDCAIPADRAAANGGAIVMPKMSIGPHGFVALIHDTEGNVVGLHSMA